MGNGITKCTNCNNTINQSDIKCSKCNQNNAKYIDYNIPLTSSDIYIKMKDPFMKEHFSPEVYTFLNSRLDDILHKRILKQAYSTTWLKINPVSSPGIPQKIFTLNEIGQVLIKIYKRYYKVYKNNLFPPGTHRIYPDVTYQNFDNRMKLVMNDIHVETDLDK